MSSSPEDLRGTGASTGAAPWYAPLGTRPERCKRSRLET